MSAPVTEKIARRLGCASNYQAHIHYWDRKRRALRYYTQLTGLLEITWERVLDDYSEARVNFRPQKGDDCCGKLKPIIDSQGNLIEPGLWPWAHELSLFRDGELVWAGPILGIDELIMPDETTDHIQITARDFLGWLDRRAIHEDIFLNDTNNPPDLTTIAERIIRTAFAPDDPDVLRHLVLIPADRRRTYSVRQWEAKAGEELRNVARIGLDFTCVGRRIMVKGPKRDETQGTITLRAKDFLAGIEIRVVGAEAATAGVAIGMAPQPPDGVPPENIPPKKRYWPPGGPAAATDPFFGLIENVSVNEGVLDENYLDWIASQKVAEGFPPPLTLSIPADSGLSPEAPVSIHHLVPSTYFTVLIAGTCRSLAQYMRLSHVRVTWTAGTPESVAVTFIPANILDDSGVEPPATTEVAP